MLKHEFKKHKSQEITDDTSRKPEIALTRPVRLGKYVQKGHLLGSTFLT
jgi:hypothetical protein